MMISDEFRQFAKRCIQVAQGARPNHRRILLTLAERWAELAADLDDGETADVRRDAGRAATDLH